MSFADDESPRSRTTVAVAIVCSLVLFLSIGTLLAVAANRNSTEQKGHASEATQVAVGSVLLVVVGGFLLLGAVSYVLMLVYVVKDCRNRSIDGGVLWMLVVSGTHFVGLLIYLASRPAGALVPCDYCGNRRLPYVSICPHCRRQTSAY